MKTILALTDFSDNAMAAAKAALVLSGKLHASLLLFNTCIDYETMNFYPMANHLANDFANRQMASKRGLTALTAGLESLADDLNECDSRPSIIGETADTDLEFTVTDILKTHDIEMIVMGARSHSIDDRLYGADSSAIIDNANRPVLIMPAGADLQHVHKIIFATDFHKADIDALHYLVKLGHLFHFVLEIVHVSHGKGHTEVSGEKDWRLKEQFTGISYQGLSYREINEGNVIHGFERLLTEDGSVALAMVHRHDPFILSLFESSLTKKLLRNQKVPLLVFPAEIA